MRRVSRVALAAAAAFAAAPSAHAAPTDLPGFTHVAGVPHGASEPPPADVGDGGPATAAWLEGITSLHQTHDGELLISEVGSPSRLRIVSAEGRIDTLPSGPLDTPKSVVGVRGGFAFVDGDEIKVVSVLGRATLRSGAAPYFPTDLAYAGVGTPPYGIFGDLWVTAGDEAGLLFHLSGTWRWEPHPTPPSTGVADRPGGGFYYTTALDTGVGGECHVWRKVGQGAPAVVAGTGACDQEPAATATGRPASEVALGFPKDVAATPDGGLVIVEQTRVSRVSPDGAFSVIYDEGFGGDQPRPQPDGIAVAADGDVVFSLGSQIFRYDGNFAPGPGVIDPPQPLPEPQPPGPGPSPPPAPEPKPQPRSRPKPTASLARPAYRLASGRRLRLTFRSSQAGRYRLDLLRRGRLVKRVTGRARRGATTIAFRVALAPGAYRLALTVTAGTTRATAGARLSVTRRR